MQSPKSYLPTNSVMDCCSIRRAIGASGAFFVSIVIWEGPVLQTPSHSAGLAVSPVEQCTALAPPGLTPLITPFRRLIISHHLSQTSLLPAVLLQSNQVPQPPCFCIAHDVGACCLQADIS